MSVDYSKIDIQLPCNILCVGATMQGKTHLTKELLKSVLKPQIDYLIIISSTNAISNDFEEFPENERTKFFDSSKDIETVIDDLIQSQSEIIKTFGKKDMPSIMCVIDDMTNTRALSFKGYLDSISVKLRHYNISTIVLVQRLASAPRTYRLNSKYAILFSTANFQELEQFIMQYVSKKYHKKLRELIIDIYDEPYNFILSKNFSNKISERLYKNGVELIQL